MKNQPYIGSELELFSKASNWKNYYSKKIKSYLGRTVLEVGAGIGGTTKSLYRNDQNHWVCLEPDPVLANQIQLSIDSGHLPQGCEVKLGTLTDLSQKETFDSIIYIDVLEHIKQDATEIELAAKHLKTDGTLIILAPAYQWLFTPFDTAIGHYRRYNKIRLSAVVPENFRCVKLLYLDSFGLIASLGNRFVLKSKMPNEKQIMVWDKLMIPISRLLDPLLNYSVGKSVLGIWRKQN